MPDAEQLQHLNEIVSSRGFEYPDNPSATLLGITFQTAFAEATAGHPLEMKVVPVVDQPTFALVEDTVSADERNKLLGKDGKPLLLDGIRPGNQACSGMALLIVGRESTADAFEPIGIRNLIALCQTDIAESYGLSLDAKGNLSRKPYAEILGGVENVLVRGWTFLFPRLGQTKITGTGVGEALGVATAAIATRFKEMTGSLAMVGEQQGLIPNSVMRQLMSLTDAGSVNINAVGFPLYQLLGYQDAATANEAVTKILGYGDVDKNTLESFPTRQLKAQRKRLELLLGENASNWQAQLEADYGVQSLIAAGNPNAVRMYTTGIAMGLVDKNMASALSAGAVLSGGPVYAGII